MADGVDSLKNVPVRKAPIEYGMMMSKTKDIEDLIKALRNGNDVKGQISAADSLGNLDTFSKLSLDLQLEIINALDIASKDKNTVVQDHAKVALSNKIDNVLSNILTVNGYWGSWPGGNETGRSQSIAVLRNLADSGKSQIVVDTLIQVLLKH